jgi:hypothetical protein
MNMNSMRLLSGIMVAGLSIGSAHAGALAYSYAKYSNFIFSGSTTFDHTAALTSSQSNAQYTGYTAASGTDPLNAPISCSGPDCPASPAGWGIKNGSLSYADAEIVSSNITTGGQAENVAQSSTNEGGGSGPHDKFGASAGSNSMNGEFTMTSTGSVSISLTPDAYVEVHSWGISDQASANIDFSVTLTNSATGAVIDQWVPTEMNIGLFQAGIHASPNTYAYSSPISWTSASIASGTTVSMNIQMGERSRFDIATTSIPEIDAMTGTGALTLLAGCFGLLADRRRTI